MLKITTLRVCDISKVRATKIGILLDYIDSKRFHEDQFLVHINSRTCSKVNRSFIFALVSHLIIQKLVFNLSSASLTFE